MISSSVKIVNSQIGIGSKVCRQAKVKNSNIDKNVIIGGNKIIIGSDNLTDIK